MKTRQKRYLFIVSFIVLLTGLLLVVGCAPKQNTVDKPPEGPVVELPEWTMNSDCTSCHSVEVASMDDILTAASAHTVLGCTGCHLDTDGKLTAAHENYSGTPDPTRLMYAKIPNSTCIGRGCHDDAGLAEDTAESTAFLELVGSTVNPHELPDCPEHTEKIFCASCHKVHAPIESVVGTASDICLGCHHDNYFEPCSDCHQEDH
ncbi:MAG: hypothetical protein FWD45_04755 [Coriobacteriia bacterium]|nr:hypothetical protein [Coriobacteriia bacterium]